MSFRFRILLALAAVGLAPLLVLGWLSFSVNRAELERTVGSAHQATAIAASRACERWIAQEIDSLRLSLSAIDFDRLTADEAATVLRIPYRQLEPVDAIALLDEKGDALAPPLAGGKAGPRLDADDLDLFGRHVPLSYAVAAGNAISLPYRGKTGPARIAIALRLAAAGGAIRIVAAQLSLAQIERQMAELARDGAVAYAVGRDGSLVAGVAGGSPGRDELSLIESGASVRRIQRPDGSEWLAAFAPTGDLGWGVVVAQPAALALRPAQRVRLYTIFWAVVALALVAIFGAFLSRGLADPIRRLSLAASALTEGRYEETAQPRTKDELGTFAEAFNHMVREVRRRDEEIRGWNAELQQRVDKASGELREAQDQILRSRRLAALGSLAAGIAHELNNPLTAVAGAASLLQEQLGAGSPHQPLLKILLDQSVRISQLGSGLRQFADQERSAAGRRFPLLKPVRDALDAHKDEIAGQGIELETELREPLPETQGDPEQIRQVVSHLVRNAIQAMPEGGRLTVRLGAVDDSALKLSVTDTGKGIPAANRERIFDPFFTTKGNRNGAGLGLSIAHSLVLAHHGKLMVDSAEGQGATFTMLLPVAAAAAHLT